MKTLPQTYKKNGYNHRIVFRENDYVITELTSIESGKFICYEVFKVKKTKSVEIFGNYLPEKEQTPCNESWGTDGFSVYTLEQAHKKIQWFKTRKRGRKPKTGKKVINLP